MSISTESEVARRAEEAARWVVRLSEAERGAPEWEECAQWLRADSDHLAAFSAAWLTWHATDCLRTRSLDKTISERLAVVLNCVPARSSSSWSWKAPWHVSALRVLGALLVRPDPC